MLFVGDFLQLPPVQSDRLTPEDLRLIDHTPSPFCLDAPCWKALNPRCFSLTRVFRQNNRAFAQLLGRLRLGIVTDEDDAQLRRRIGHPRKNKDGILPTSLFATNRDADRQNDRCLEQLPKPQYIYTMRFEVKTKASEGKRKLQPN